MSKRSGQITLDPSHHHTPSLNCLTLQSSEHQNDQTQKQFLPSGNPSHEHLTIIMVHTLFIHLFIWHTYLVYTSIAHNIHVHPKLSIVIYLYIQLYICVKLFLILFNSSFYYLCFCSVTDILLHCSSFYHKNKFLVCVNIPGNKAHSDSVSHDLSEIILICRFSAQETFLTNNIIEKNMIL